eukprot:TRINITY_DN1456_c0_g1_i1.p1 TRINITY_DN1456_c0_g1~~TRINITY_DN1456_c0_g1_i1.p1  ORF type:complete len:256 (+),score=41.12 TRINITY_DN1456_c0_g1_i1:300-1067(+)
MAEEGGECYLVVRPHSPPPPPLQSSKALLQVQSSWCTKMLASVERKWTVARCKVRMQDYHDELFSKLGCCEVVQINMVEQLKEVQEHYFKKPLRGLCVMDDEKPIGGYISQELQVVHVQLRRRGPLANTPMPNDQNGFRPVTIIWGAFSGSSSGAPQSFPCMHASQASRARDGEVVLDGLHGPSSPVGLEKELEEVGHFRGPCNSFFSETEDLSPGNPCAPSMVTSAGRRRASGSLGSSLQHSLCKNKQCEGGGV